MRVPEALEALGGFATREELLRMRCWPEAIDLAVYYRLVIRVRRAQYASLGTDPAVLRALRFGGRLACVSALAYYAGEVSPALQVLVRHGSSRHTRPPGEAVVVHWTRRDLAGSRLVVAEGVARAQAATCG